MHQSCADCISGFGPVVQFLLLRIGVGGARFLGRYRACSLLNILDQNLGLYCSVPGLQVFFVFGVKKEKFFSTIYQS
jgi:hypothetical protein